MKTLDEVIDAMERCSIPHYFDCKGCPYEDDDAEVGCRSDDRDADALHYLKEYRKYAKVVDERYAEIEKKQSDAYWMWVNKTAELERNDPLTWGELKSMEGKPVWVELKRKETEVGRKAWGLNDGTYVDAFGYDIVTVKVLHDLWHLSKAQLGKTWQAYRKERE